MIVTEGINFILDVSLSSLAKAPNLYIGLFKNNYTPLITDVALTFPGVGVANEATTEYDEATRQLWIPGTVSGGSINNNASKAVFTFNTTVSIYGVFLATTSTKGGTTGKLIQAKKFASVRNMDATSTLEVGITIPIANA